MPTVTPRSLRFFGRFFAPRSKPALYRTRTGCPYLIVCDDCLYPDAGVVHIHPPSVAIHAQFRFCCSRRFEKATS
jgi:hypothetical protein